MNELASSALMVPQSGWAGQEAYPDWGQVFGDEFAAAAVIDRLLHFSVTVNIRGESYRLKDKKKAAVFAAPTVKATG